MKDTSNIRYSTKEFSDYKIRVIALFKGDIKIHIFTDTLDLESLEAILKNKTKVPFVEFLYVQTKEQDDATASFLESSFNSLK